MAVSDSFQFRSSFDAGVELLDELPLDVSKSYTYQMSSCLLCGDVFRFSNFNLNGLFLTYDRM